MDEENEVLTKTIEFRILTQYIIERIGELFGKIEKLRTLHQLIKNETDIKKDIIEKKEDTLDKLKNMRVNMREIKHQYKEMCTKDLFTEKLELIKDILKLNKVDDNRFYDDEFWKNRVDAGELQSFLTGILMRGKKKEIMMQNPDEKQSLE